MEITETIGSKIDGGTITDPKIIGEVVLQMAIINEILDKRLELDFLKLKKMIADIDLTKFRAPIWKILGDSHTLLLQKLSYFHRDYLREVVKNNRGFKLKLPKLVVDEVPDVCDLSLFKTIIKDYYENLDFRHGDVIQIDPLNHFQVIKISEEITKIQALPSPDYLVAGLTKEQLEYLDSLDGVPLEVGLIGIAASYIPPQDLNRFPELQGKKIPIPELPEPKPPLLLESTPIVLPIENLISQKKGPEFVQIKNKKM